MITAIRYFFAVIIGLIIAILFTLPVVGATALLYIAIWKVDSGLAAAVCFVAFVVAIAEGTSFFNHHYSKVMSKLIYLFKL